MKNVRRMFTAAERSNIAQRSVGKPTGVKFKLDEFEFDLVPLTNEQGETVFGLIEAFSELQRKAESAGESDTSAAALLELIGKYGKSITRLVRDLLFESAKATGLITKDDYDESVNVFDEWIGRLPLKATLFALVPKVLEANDLRSLLGANPSIPSSEQSTLKTPPAASPQPAEERETTASGSHTD